MAAGFGSRRAPEGGDSARARAKVFTRAAQHEDANASKRLVELRATICARVLTRHFLAIAAAYDLLFEVPRTAQNVCFFMF